MKELHFNIINGECVSPFTCLPSHKAIISGSKIHRIEACFNVSNIVQKGYQWFLEGVEEENIMWSKTHPHLMKSLKRLALRQSIKHPFKYSNFSLSNHRFPYVLVWHRKKEFSESYFFDPSSKDDGMTIKTL